MPQNAAPPAEPYLSPEEASLYLRRTWGIARSGDSLSTYRCRGGGPRYLKAGRSVLYDQGDLDAWAADLLRGAPKLRGAA
jgi:hypothetical protein